MSFVLVDEDEFGEVTMTTIAGGEASIRRLDSPTGHHISTALGMRRFHQKLRALRGQTLFRDGEEAVQLRIDNVLIPSPFRNIRDEAAKLQAIAADFNKGIDKPIIVNAGMRSGRRVPPGFMQFAHKNHRCEVVMGHGQRVALRLLKGTVYTKAEWVGPPVKMDSYLTGNHGTFIINVPSGCMAKVWSREQPLLLDEGVHVIHDPLFSVASDDGTTVSDAAHQLADVLPEELIQVLLEAEGDGRDLSDEEIEELFQAGNERFLRGNTGTTLPNWIVSKNTPQFDHGCLHYVRVGVGECAKVIVDTEPMFLEGQGDPYVFDTPFFEFISIEPLNQNHMNCETLHRLLIPAGYLCLCWSGAEGKMLMPHAEPYKIDDDLFRLRGRLVGAPRTEFTGTGLFGDSLVPMSTELVAHGSMLAINPRPDTVAVISSPKGLRFLLRRDTIDQNVEVFNGFINSTIETKLFPRHGLFRGRTADSFRLDLKVLVAYRIATPSLLLKNIALADVEAHIEALVISDIAAAMQQCTCTTFTNVASMVQPQLSAHLRVFGIELVRVGLEEARPLDNDVESLMAKYLTEAAELRTKTALLESTGQVELAKMQRDVDRRVVLAEQRTEARISRAKAALEEKRAAAQAMVAKAEAECKQMALLGETLRNQPEQFQTMLTELWGSARDTWDVTTLDPSVAKSQFGALSAIIAASDGNLSFEPWNHPISAELEDGEDRDEPRVMSAESFKSITEAFRPKEYGRPAKPAPSNSPQQPSPTAAKTRKQERAERYDVAMDALRAAYSGNQWAEVERNATAVLEDFGDFPRAVPLRMRCVAYMQLGVDFDKAESDARSAIYEDDGAKSYSCLATVTSRKGQHRDAIEWYEKALKIAQENPSQYPASTLKTCRDGISRCNAVLESERAAAAAREEQPPAETSPQRAPPATAPARSSEEVPLTGDQVVTKRMMIGRGYTDEAATTIALSYSMREALRNFPRKRVPAATPQPKPAAPPARAHAAKKAAPAPPKRAPAVQLTPTQRQTVQTLVGMGFDRPAAEIAAKTTSSVEEAINVLL